MPASRALDDDSVVPLVRKTAAWAWRLLVIVLAVVVLLWVVRRLQVIVVPVALATMVAALMVPAVDWLDRRGAPRGGAVALVLLGGAAIFGGILTFVVSQFVSGLPSLVEQVTRSIDNLRGLAHRGTGAPEPGTDRQRGQHRHQGAAGQPGEADHGGAVHRGDADRDRDRRAADAVHADLPVARRAQHLRVRHPDRAHRRAANRCRTRAGPDSLADRLRRATFLVALVDAVGIGTGLAIMGIPLALPLASLVFLGAFIPLVGAVLSGFLAVVVALLAKGFVYALITLGLIIAVQQLEAHVLQPLVMGRAVSIHPLPSCWPSPPVACSRASSAPCWRCLCSRCSTAPSAC
jgi:hypothetical protein